ncbi:MAG: CoA transferase [Acidimicrobiaceae bacterium]|nr:CoA transferase [Acidimicrobiaceae bacterium]
MPAEPASEPAARAPAATAADAAAEAPLAGVRVVEMTMYVQGPTSGLTLASLGADVIKIEQVGQADYMRNFTSLFGVTFDERGQEWLYGSVNRNKRSLVLDVASEAGRPVFERLIGQADAFISNMRADGLERFGADPDTLLGINPRLVYCRGGGLTSSAACAAAPPTTASTPTRSSRNWATTTSRSLSSRSPTPSGSARLLPGWG